MMAQLWDPERYATNARFVSDLGAEVVALLAPRAGERLLDLGCGDGALTERLVAAGAQVTAIDASAAMVAAARARGLDARLLGAEALGSAAHSFPDGAFDGIFTNAVLHWVPDHAALAHAFGRLLAPGGRVVGEFGGAGNVAPLVEALDAALAAEGLDGRALDPWTFPEAEVFAGHLTAAGLSVTACTLFDRPTPLPGTAGAWLETFANQQLSAVRPERRQAVLTAVERALETRLAAGGRWTLPYVRLRFRAEKPA